MEKRHIAIASLIIAFVVATLLQLLNQLNICITSFFCSLYLHCSTSSRDCQYPFGKKQKYFFEAFSLIIYYFSVLKCKIGLFRSFRASIPLYHIGGILSSVFLKNFFLTTQPCVSFCSAPQGITFIVPHPRQFVKYFFYFFLKNFFSYHWAVRVIFRSGTL